MKKLIIGRKHAAIGLWLLSCTIFSGCSYHVMPANVPLIQANESISLSGCAVIVTNSEKETGDYSILNVKGENTGLVTNRRIWSEKLVEALARELARRGAQVRSSAPVKLEVSVPDIKISQDGERFTFEMKTSVSVYSPSSGWSKTYEAKAESKLGNFESLDTLTDRLAGEVIASAVKMMLADAEFIEQLKGTPLPHS